MFNTQAITFELIFIASTNELHTLTPNKFYFITNNVDVFSEKKWSFSDWNILFIKNHTKFLHTNENKKIHGDRAHIDFSFEWNSVSRWFDLLTIKQIESTNQAINSYKQHNKLKHWHNVSDGLVKLLCSGCGTNRRKIFWYDLVSLYFSSSLFSIHRMIFLRGTHTVCVSSECIKNVFCLSMLVKELNGKVTCEKPSSGNGIHINDQ